MNIANNNPMPVNTVESPLLQRLVKGTLYVFGTPDPAQFYMGEFYNQDANTFTIGKPLILRIVQNGAQVSLSAMFPGDIVGIKPEFYTLHKIGITYASAPPKTMKDAYIQATSKIIIPPAGGVSKFGGM